MRRILVTAGLLAALAAGCGAASEEGSPSAEVAAADNADGGAEASEVAASAAEPTVPPVDDRQSSSAPSADGAEQTLADYLGPAARIIRGDGGGNLAAGIDTDLLEQQRLIEIEVQRCMLAQGFDYTPTEVGGGIGALLAEQNEGLSDEEFAEQLGFGISTRFDALLDGSIELETTDANDDLLASMSEGEADAWQLALNGEPPVRNDQGQLVDPNTGEVIQGGRGRGRATGGCRLEAQQDVRGDFSALADLADEFEALDARIDADPRIVEMAREWTACMREAGFTYETEDEARNEIRQSFRPIAVSFRRGGPNAAPTFELSEEQEAELDRVQELERTVALASFGCTSDTRLERAEIVARYEAEFVDANRTVLEQLGG